MILTLSVLVASNHPTKSIVKELEQPAKVQFALASWNHPDEYGQGISGFLIKENSTGGFLSIKNPDTGIDFCYPENSTNYELNYTADTALMFMPRFMVNYTLLGLTHPADMALGINYIRANISFALAGETLFTQQNLTYDYLSGLVETGIWYFAYYVYIPIILVAGAIYTLTVTYEVFYEGSYQGSPYLHDCSTTDNIVYDSDKDLSPGEYGIASDGDIVEIWITPVATIDEYVIYKLDFTNIDTSEGGINITTRYMVEDTSIGFRLDVYYTDSTSDTTGLQTSLAWANVTIITDSNKALDYVLIWCDDNPNSVASGNRSVYVDYIEITNEAGVLTYLTDQWNNVGEAIILFHVLIHPWGLNALLILLGMILVVLCGVYLVKGGRSEASMNKVFYALVMFMLGWGLIVGGILP
jgi:hypothetical protein